MKEMREAMARSLGRPPEGQEHRAWVDHESLRGVEPGGYEWKKNLGYTGLDSVDVADPEVPATLRALLLSAGPAPLGSFLPLVVPIVAVWSGLGLTWVLGFLAAGPLLASLIGTLVGVSIVVSALEDEILVGWERVAGAPAPWSARSRVLRALDALEETPFVIQVDGRLLENVPVLSRLHAWELEVEESLSAAEGRLVEVLRLRERIEDLRQHLDEPGADGHSSALRELVSREETLRDRSRGLLERIRDRQQTLGDTLEEVRARAELESLRDRTRELAGEAADDTQSRVAADIELDVGDLSAEVEAIRRDVADESLRLAALGELSAHTGSPRTDR